jgi:hypothetical protein
MKGIIVLSILVLSLAGCSAARTEVAPQDTHVEDPDIAATFAYVMEDIDIGDGGLLSGQPCASPCAFGIRIGETQLDQVIPVLENNGISRCWTEPNISWSLISCGGNRFRIQVDMHTRLVNSISYDPSVPISLGVIIEKYGEPNYVTVDPAGLSTSHQRLYWNSMRMLVVLMELSGGTHDIQDTTEVKGISFSDENLYRTSEKESAPYYKPWNGYGMYQSPPEALPSIPLATITPTP